MLEFLGILIFLFVIGLSIALHEVGHLVPAKKFGVKVTEYAVGFGPQLFKRQIGETKYGIRAVPLGGYIRMVGMYAPDRKDKKRVGGPFAHLIDQAREESAAEIDPGQDHRAFYSLPVWKKLVVMTGGPVMNLLLAIVFFTIVFSGIGVATASTKIGEVIPCVPTQQNLSGNQTNGVCLDSKQTPALLAGIQAGDRLVSVGNTEIASWEDVSAALSTAQDDIRVVTENPQGQQRSFLLTLATLNIEFIDENGNPTGETINRKFIGVSPKFEFVPMPVTAVPGEMWRMTTASISALASFPQKISELVLIMINGDERDPNGPVSVVGVSRISGEIVASDLGGIEKVQNLLGLAASLNLFLFIFNLVPLLPLDGGHAAGAIFEGLRKRVAKIRNLPDPGPIDTARALPLTYVVAALLLSAGLIVIVADILNPISLFG
ncbi:MAG: hypothetical protein RIS09_1203 [Actinomycetota bacterium]|jgi:membrane-associated protease RseP (regulator of RpoE activity)